MPLPKGYSTKGFFQRSKFPVLFTNKKAVSEECIPIYFQGTKVGETSRFVQGGFDIRYYFKITEVTIISEYFYLHAIYDLIDDVIYMKHLEVKVESNDMHRLRQQSKGFFMPLCDFEICLRRGDLMTQLKRRNFDENTELFNYYYFMNGRELEPKHYKYIFDWFTFELVSEKRTDIFTIERQYRYVKTN